MMMGGYLFCSLPAGSSSGPVALFWLRFFNCLIILLFQCAEIIAIPLYLLFSKSLESGVVPADWKLANVSAIHKKGSRAMASHYRPVSLTCLASIMDAMGMVQH